MNLMDDAKDELDEAGEKMKDLGDNVDDMVHEKKGEMEGRIDQAKDDREMEEDE